MIAAIGNSAYPGRRVAPLLRELNGSDDPLVLSTDHPRKARSAAGPERIQITDRATGRHFDDCRAALAAGMTHLRDSTTAGLVDFPAILRRVAALETII